MRLKWNQKLRLKIERILKIDESIDDFVRNNKG